MPRLSIDITAEEHQKLKVISAFIGKSIKQYILEKALYDVIESPDLKNLEQFLAPRILSAKQGNFSTATNAKDIFLKQINKNDAC
jgi:hypothetical protein